MVEGGETVGGGGGIAVILEKERCDSLEKLETLETDTETERVLRVSVLFLPFMICCWILERGSQGICLFLCCWFRCTDLFGFSFAPNSILFSYLFLFLFFNFTLFINTRWQCKSDGDSIRISYKSGAKVDERFLWSTIGLDIFTIF